MMTMTIIITLWTYKGQVAELDAGNGTPQGSTFRKVGSQRQASPSKSGAGYNPALAFNKENQYKGEPCSLNENTLLGK